MAEEARFKRYETKYLLSEEQYREFRKRTEGKLTQDAYGLTDICNCYIDTPDYRLIRQSLEKGIYKEKLRLRSYGVPTEGSQKVFLELKKKYDGVVYKRREAMEFYDALAFIYGARSREDSQILKEMDWVFRFYKDLHPMMFLSYKRVALFEAKNDDGSLTHTGNDDLRITFDTDICWRTKDVDLRKGIYGNKLLEPGQRIMEVKAPAAMPIWLVEILNGMQVYPTSYSKYGKAYEQLLTENGKRLIA